MSNFFDKYSASLLIACFFMVGSAPSFGSDREPTAHSYDFVRSICQQNKNSYICQMEEMDGKQCLVAYCISGSHKNKPAPWYYSCPGEST